MKPTRINAAWVVVLLALPAGALLFGANPDVVIEEPDGTDTITTYASPTFSAPVQVGGTGNIEPSVRVDSTGVIYVAAARGLPSVSPVYRSEDGGSSWQRLPMPPGSVGPLSASITGGVGAEPELSLAADDTLYVTELTVAGVTVFKYTNHGRTLAGWTVLGETSTAVDRQWQTVGAANAVGGHEMFINTNDVGRGIVQYYTPDPMLVPATKPKVLVRLGGSPSVPPVYDHTSGFVYSGIPEANRLWAARTSSDVFGLVAPNPAKFAITQVGDPVNQFTTTAVDAAGNAYVAWSQPSAGSNYDVFVSVSSDYGFTWSTPLQVSEGGNNVYPWMDAGEDGRVGIVWYHADDGGDPETNKGPWRIQFGQVLDATSATPSVHVTTLPTIVQNGHGICLSGTGCSLSATGSRALGDYFQVAIGPDGMAHIAFSAADNGQSPKMFHVKQTSGQAT